MPATAILFLIGTALFLAVICTTTCFITAHVMKKRYEKWGDLSPATARRALEERATAPWEKDT